LVIAGLLRPQTSTSVTSSTYSLLADLKSQQAEAMAGDAGSGASPVAHGLRVNGNQYTLFKGSSYSAGDADNFTVTLDQPLTVTTALPSAVAVFNERSGEVSGWTSGQNTVTIKNTVSGEQHILTLNRYGAVTVN